MPITKIGLLPPDDPMFSEGLSFFSKSAPPKSTSDTPTGEKVEELVSSPNLEPQTSRKKLNQPKRRLK
jgi:hypothetical protein